MKYKDGINYILINSTFFVFIFYLLHKLNVIDEIINILSLLFFSLILSYIIYPIYNVINKKLNSILSIILIYIILLLIILFLIYSIIPNTNFINNVIELFSNILKFVDKINTKYNLNINLEIYMEKIINYIINNGVYLVRNLISYLSKFIFVIILSICILLNIKYIRLFINKFKHKELLFNINNKLKNYLIANIKIIFIQFIEYTLIFLIIGHPNYLLLGILNSINSFVPYVGTLLTNIIAITTASVIDKKLLILTGVVSIILPNIDSYFITPRIYKSSNKLPQTLCVTSVILFGLLFGIFGVVLAVPILIIVIEILKYKNVVKLE